MKSLETIRKEVEKLQDKLGKPVEEHIKELVIGLRWCGITTESSCEGHEEYGAGYPWVKIAYDQAEKLVQVLGWQNRPVLPNNQPNKNIWVIRPGGLLELMPENRNLPLKKLQEQAIEFGHFLQDREDDWFHEDCFRNRFKKQT